MSKRKVLFQNLTIDTTPKMQEIVEETDSACNIISDSDLGRFDSRKEL